MRRRPVYPLPEILPGPRGGPGWAIHPRLPEYANCSITERIMQVPLTEEPEAYRARVHEMAHAAWSPPVIAVEGVDDMTILQHVEDCRMHCRLERVGISRNPLCFHDFWASNLDALQHGQMGTRDLAILLVGRNFTPEFAAWSADIEALAKAEPSRARAEQLREAVRIAKAAGELMMAPPFHIFPPPFSRTETVAKAVLAMVGILSSREEEEEEEEEEESAAVSIFPSALALAFEPPAPGGSVSPWGTMTVEEPPPTVVFPGRWNRRIARPEGTVPRDWARYCTDGRVFGARVKAHKRPTILVDCSGSMQFTVEHVEKICETFPYAKIACYSGMDREPRGVLRVVVANNMRVSKGLIGPFFGENVIDGPALEWLAQQPGPRVWLSDGYVSGVDCHCHNPTKMAQANLICVQGDIARCETLAATLRYLKKPRRARAAA